MHKCKFCGASFHRSRPDANNEHYCSIDCRFWSKVDKSGGESACWPWLASKGNYGYGRFGIGDSVVRSNRYVYESKIGPIAADLCVCHRCDNPSCCNPSHLFLGTHQENMLDMHAKGRNHMTPDGLERLKASKRGKPRTEEVRQKLSAALVGRKVPSEVVQKIADANRGKKRSEETKAKMRAAWERRKQAGVWLQAK